MEKLDDLRLFVQVAQAGSFTRAAARLGMSQSNLSYAIKALERRLGLKLFNRTTRSIATTATGEQLLRDIEPLLSGIERKLALFNEFRDVPQGTLRINASDLPFRYVLWERLQGFMNDYPGVSLELICDVRFIDIVAERFDAGVRLGDTVAKDMIAVRISPDLRMCVCAAPGYLAQHGAPQTPADLAGHQCLALRLPTHSDLLAWEFVDPGTGKTVRHMPQGRIVSNHGDLLRQVACAGNGLIWAAEFTVAAEVESGALVRALEDWAITYPGYHLYYPNRRTDSPLFQALVKALRWE